MWRDTIMDLLEVNHALNAYNSALKDADSFVAGRRIYNLRAAEKRLKEALWNYRTEIAGLIRDRVA